MTSTVESLQNRVKDCTELVVVCCHATYLGDGASTAEDQWLLQPFQQSDPATGKASEHETFIAHILAGALKVAQHPNALIIFSGGKTADHRRSEAEGYAQVLTSMSSRFPEAAERYELEEHATDSYQNLLFSILRFRQVSGRYPRLVTVITHAFKERRFLELHAGATKWAREFIRVQGINPPFTIAELEQTRKGELERAYKLFAQDPYGVRPPLAEKRLARNWDVSSVNGLSDDANVKALLYWNGGDSGIEVFPLPLPWTSDGDG